MRGQGTERTSRPVQIPRHLRAGRPKYLLLKTKMQGGRFNKRKKLNRSKREAYSMTLEQLDQILWPSGRKPSD